MKRVVFCLYGIRLWAAPIGNPASPALLEEGFFISDTVWCQPRASFAEDFLMNQRLSGSQHLTHVGNVKISGTTSLGSLTWSIRERFDLSFVGGGGSEGIEFSLHDSVYKGKLNGGLVWYAESKLILFEVKKTTVSAFGQVGGWNWMSGPLKEDNRIVTDGADLSMRFWAAGATLTQKIFFFSPYGGVAVMRSRWKLDHTKIGNYNFHQKYPVGPVFGCSLSNANKMLLNFEWRGWVENACTISGEVRF